jgi:hypothetical protein
MTGVTELPDPDTATEPRPTGVLTGCDGADGVESVFAGSEHINSAQPFRPRVFRNRPDSVTPRHKKKEKGREGPSDGGRRSVTELVTGYPARGLHPVTPSRGGPCGEQFRIGNHNPQVSCRTSLALVEWRL